MIQIDYVPDWTARLRGRLYQQFKSAVTWSQWCDLLGRQFQDLEDAGQTLFNLLDIDGNSGAQLDFIGRLVGQKRSKADDATYRFYLKARIAANRSTGTPEDLYVLFRALVGKIGFVYTGSPTREFSLRVKGPITRAAALAGVDFLGDAKEATARALLEWQETTDANLFRFDSGPGYDAGAFAGAAQA